jgi:hypothetical protein
VKPKFKKLASRKTKQSIYLLPMLFLNPGKLAIYNLPTLPLFVNETGERNTNQ